MKTAIRANILGEQTAEHDHERLDTDYVETPEYRSVLETRDSLCSRRSPWHR